jgi:hypothetical protein
VTSKTDENVDQVKELVYKNRRITIHDIANMLGVSFGSVQSFLIDSLNMHWLAVKFMPSLLSKKQKERCINMCRDFQARLEGGAEFFSKIIKGDETWVYGYDPETKKQSSQWKSP